MKNRLGSFLMTVASPLVFALLVASCEKFETFPNPPIVGGECEFSDRWYQSEASAKAELDRLKQIFLSSTLGSKSVEVLRASTFVSANLNGTAQYWGLQLVYSCDAAEIKTERMGGFEYEADAVKALAQRKATLDAGRYTKVLSWTTNDLSTTSCSTCCDADGYNCGDCSCSTDYEYGYTIVYAEVNPNNPRQAAIIQAFLENKAMLNAVSGKKNPTITDTLAVARKVLPSGSAAGKLVEDWHRLFTKMDFKNSLPKRKACPAGAKEIPGSRHQVR